MESNQIVLPFLKWAGGKRWLVGSHSHIFPKHFNTYFEPFLGSGAVYFHLRPARAVLSDKSNELIDVYRAIRDRPDLVKRYLREHQSSHSEDYYYFIRESLPTALASRAARTIYLNRTCWNGLYRVNRKGKFNVPIGTKTTVQLPTDNFEYIAKLLSSASLISQDFEEVLCDARRGDFAFIDPPYTVKHNLNGFIKYNEELYSWADQLRLRDIVEDLALRGIKVLVTNADHESIHDLYRDFQSTRLKRASVIAGDKLARGNYSELAIRCW